ncbi:MAG TPA: hypothetical protein VLK65_23900 [Vicinamibacteria bacterium]|nr:hypothetical protein [Vicinamibacteria bacterium]
MTTYCGHELCRCNVDGKEFCSSYCKEAAARQMAAVSDDICFCGHSSCWADEE